MKKFSALVFDETIYTTTATYTPQHLNEALANADRLVLHAVADEAGGTSPTLTVQIEHSGDGRNWLSKQGAAEISLASLTAGATSQAMGSDSSTIPSLAFCRLRIQLAGTSPTAHVKVYACGRDW